MSKISTSRTSRRAPASKTDWPRVKAMRDADIDLSDLPEITAEKAAHGVVRVAGKVVPRGKTRLTMYLDAAVVDMRFVRPLDTEMILEMANETDLLVTVEDNVRHGGAGSAVNEVLLAQHHAVPVLNLGLPDQFVEHGTREELLAQCGLDSAGILRAIQKRLRSKDLDEQSVQQRRS